MTLSVLNTSTALEEWQWTARECRAPRVRSMRQFGEEEIVMPSGPYKDRRFRADWNPHTRLWFDAVASGRYDEIVTTGPVQSGKSFMGYVLPIVYTLCELRENVICGVPLLAMADEKWTVDLLPVIEASRYRRYLPRTGPGSKGGSVAQGRPIRFLNGTTLRFMSGGSGDKGRAGATARVLVITEVDGFERQSATSDEADKITQLEGRTQAYGSRAIVYKECTLTTERGHTHRRYTEGTESRIYLGCPHCRRFVAPEREHFTGYEDAADVEAARAQGSFFCPDCGQQWSDADRRQAHADMRLVHRGQEITAGGQVTGPHPPTRTFGYRWCATNNLLVDTPKLAALMWAAQRDPNEENAEKHLCQYVWVRPYRPPAIDLAPLDAEIVRRRFAQPTWTKGLVPEDTEHLTMGVDVGKRVSWWALVAWRPEARGHVVDYGSFEVASDSITLETAVLLALRDFRDEIVLRGFRRAGGGLVAPEQVFVDSRYARNAVFAFVKDKDSQTRFRAAMGCGAGQHYEQAYYQPKRTGNTCIYIGEGYHIALFPDHGVQVAEVNADHWKSFLHDRLRTPAGEPGSMVLYHSTDRHEHTRLAKHLTAERREQIFVPGKGYVDKWIRASRANHLLDCAANACAAGHLVGVRVIKTPAPSTIVEQPAGPSPLRTPDGRPFVATQR